MPTETCPLCHNDGEKMMNFDMGGEEMWERAWRGGGGFSLDLFMEAGDLTSGSPLIILYKVLCWPAKRHWRQAKFYYLLAYSLQQMIL